MVAQRHIRGQGFLGKSLFYCNTGQELWHVLKERDTMQRYLLFFIHMASASKKNLVRLVSTGGSGTFFVRKANNKDKGKLSMRKYDKKLRKHVMFEEKKMK